MAKKVKYVEITDADQIWDLTKKGKDLIFVDLHRFDRIQWTPTMDVNILRNRISLFRNENQDNSKHFFLEVVEDE